MADKSIIGRTGKPFKMPIEWSKVREFARAIKDPSAEYFDPEAGKEECSAEFPCPSPFCRPAHSGSRR